MNPAYYLLIFLPLLLLLWQRREQRQAETIRRIIKRRREGKAILTGFIEKYIGKYCLIYTMNSQVEGTVKAVEDNWIELEKDGSTQILNADYIVRVREYPLNKKGKRKSIVGD